MKIFIFTFENSWLPEFKLQKGFQPVGNLETKMYGLIYFSSFESSQTCRSCREKVLISTFVVLFFSLHLKALTGNWKRKYAVYYAILMVDLLKASLRFKFV